MLFYFSFFTFKKMFLFFFLHPKRFPFSRIKIFQKPCVRSKEKPPKTALRLFTKLFSLISEIFAIFIFVVPMNNLYNFQLVINVLFKLVLSIKWRLNMFLLTSDAWAGNYLQMYQTFHAIGYWRVSNSTTRCSHRLFYALKLFANQNRNFIRLHIIKSSVRKKC